MTNAQKAASVARILSQEKAMTFDLASVLKDIKEESEKGSKSILPAMAVVADIITIGGLLYAISCKVAEKYKSRKDDRQTRTDLERDFSTQLVVNEIQLEKIIDVSISVHFSRTIDDDKS